MRSIAAAASLSVFFMLGSAQAQQAKPPLYGELGYSFLEVKDFDVTKTNPQALRGIIGYNFHPYLAAEGMLAFGTSSDSDRGIDYKVKWLGGVFLKPKYDFNNVEVFARLGWAHANVRASGRGRTTTENDDDFAYGIGANYAFNPRMYVGIDWMRYTHKDHMRVEGTTVNFGYRF